ncbi:MAG TPA: hypothetical protein VIW19_14525 [Gaiellaceae bacterium]|jgi:hypothetical protein
MKRFAVLLLLFSTFGLGAVGAGSAAEGNGYGPWESTFQGAITAPAGAVCSFQVTAAPVREDIRVRYHYDSAGNVDGYESTGQLIARITNDETGASVVRNLSGPGTVTLYPDGSYDATAGGNFLIFFLAQDDPAHQLLLISGRTVLHGDASGAKTLVSHEGQVENLCDTLA